MANNRIGGKLFIRVGDVAITLAGNWTCQPGFDLRTGQKGPNGPTGYTEEGQIPSIEGDGTFRPETDPKQLLDVTNATITAELANGQVFILSEGWQAGTGEIDLVAGTIKLKYEGMAGQFVK